MPLFKAEGQPRAPGFAPSLGRRQREEEEGPTAWVAGAALGTARCQEVRSPSSGRRAGAAPFPAVVCPESEHMLSSQPGHRQARRCLEKLQPFSLSSLSPSSCRGEGSNHFRAHKPRSHSFTSPGIYIQSHFQGTIIQILSFRGDFTVNLKDLGLLYTEEAQKKKKKHL